VNTFNSWDAIIQLAQYGKALNNWRSISPEERRQQIKEFYRLAKTILNDSHGQLNHVYNHGLFDINIIGEFKVNITSQSETTFSGDVNKLHEVNKTSLEEKLRAIGFSETEIQELTNSPD